MQEESQNTTRIARMARITQTRRTASYQLPAKTAAADSRIRHSALGQNELLSHQASKLLSEPGKPTARPTPELRSYEVSAGGTEYDSPGRTCRWGALGLEPNRFHFRSAEGAARSEAERQTIKRAASF